MTHLVYSDKSHLECLSGNGGTRREGDEENYLGVKMFFTLIAEVVKWCLYTSVNNYQTI
jgi:hypothetical protein